MRTSGELVSYLRRNPLPWLHYDEKSKTLIVVVDNHLMQTYRACPQHFFRANVEGWKRKSNKSVDGQQRIWNLDFGILLHKMLELYYQNFQKPAFDANAWFIDRAIKEWQEAEMDVHCEEKEFKLIGGLQGFIGILTQYAAVLGPQTERLRVLGAEVSFGRAKEVPLFVGKGLEIYLAGRMDLIVDDGYFICPMDHKSEGVFRGEPGLKYETEEGPTGYIYALSKILPSLLPEGEILKRDCSKILMNLIQKKPTTNPAERFKRVAIRKTAEQLEDYRGRMVTTVVHMLKDMERYVLGLNIQRDTTKCTNWYFRDCLYRDVCRQGSREGADATLQNGFVKLPIWNTEEVKPTT